MDFRARVADSGRQATASNAAAAAWRNRALPAAGCQRPAIRAILTVAALLVAGGPTLHGASKEFEARVAEAIGAAVAERVDATDVAVSEVVVTATPIEGRLMARPAPGVRTGQPGTFALTVHTASGPRRIGSAQATVTIEAAALRAVRDLARGAIIELDDVTLRHGAVDGVLLTALPQLTEAQGARVRRSLPAGAVLTADAIVLMPLVRSGQAVVLRALVGHIEARGTGIATQNGRMGAVIRVVNPRSRRTLVGRVTGPGEVEVIHGS